MHMTYDADADALSIRLRTKRPDEPRLRTKTISEGVMVDFDAEGNPVGFEILWASERYPAETLTAAEPLGEFISLSQAAAIAGLSPDTLKAQAASKRLRAEKHGRNWVTTRTWLQEYLDNRKHGGPGSRSAAGA